jgi:hypothetical protein
VLSTGGTSVQLNPDLLFWQDVSGSFDVSPNNLAVVYLLDAESDDVEELYVVPTIGGDSTRLSGEILPTEGNIVSFKIAPDSLSVVYRADQEVDDKFELFATYDAHLRFLPIVKH